MRQSGFRRSGELENGEVRSVVKSVIPPNQVWVADITYINILFCFIYLAVILDVYSRKAIGYAISRNIDTQLTLAALRMAIVNRNPPWGCIHHSDRCVHYASAD